MFTQPISRWVRENVRFLGIRNQCRNMPLYTRISFDRLAVAEIRDAKLRMKKEE